MEFVVEVYIVELVEGALGQHQLFFGALVEIDAAGKAVTATNAGVLHFGSGTAVEALVVRSVAQTLVVLVVEYLDVTKIAVIQPAV